MSQAPAKPPRMVDARQFERCYTDAYSNIDKAITLVTENQHEQAYPLFQIGLTFLDKAIDMKVSSLSDDPATVQHYYEMQTKMRRTRKEVLYHFTDSQLSTGALGKAGYPVTNTPTYADSSAGPASYPMLPDVEATPAVQLPPPSAPPRRGSGGVQAPDSLNVPAAGSTSNVVTPVMSPQEGQLVFKLDSGVQIFFIYPDGSVTSPSSPSFLAVVTFDAPLDMPSSNHGSTRGFIQVGEWSYPIVSQASPVLHSFYGAYMFPDPNNSVPGSHVGIIIPDSVSSDERELFEAVLIQLTCYVEQASLPTKEGEAVAAERISPTEVRSASERLSAGAEKVSSGVVWGAEKLSGLMTHWSDKLAESSPAVGTEGSNAAPSYVDPKWQSTAIAARKITGGAVKVSSYLLGQVGKATMYLGRSLAPHLQHHGTKAISSITGQSHSAASGQIDGVMDVAAGAVRGASTVYMGLEKAAQTLAVSLTSNTVKVVTHKYGADAGQLADNTMYAVGQTAMAGHNISSLGVKGVAKRAAKDTGKALVLNHKDNKPTRVEGSARGAAQVTQGLEEEVVEGMEIGEEACETSKAVVPK